MFLFIHWIYGNTIVCNLHIPSSLLQSTMVTCEDIRLKLESFSPIVALSMSEVSELDMGCKTLLLNYIEKKGTANPNDIIKIQAVIDYMHEKINIGNWKEVRIFLRKTVTIASFLKLTCYLENCNEISECILRECFKIIDFGILFGCPIDKEPTLLQKCAEIINSLCPSFDNSPIDTPRIEQITVIENSFNATPIPVIECPSMEVFYKNYILKQEPVILDNGMNHWPALSKWKDQNYFMKLAGMRTVSIELGNKYTDSDWTQKLMTLEDFIKNHIVQENGPTGYLAQYQLFDHIPELKKDIAVPDYCCFSDSEEPVDIMAWYGPKGTVSPVHHDPKRNLLSQVIGEKQLFLFSPQDSEYLYPHDHQLLNNTARIDPRKPDLELYPKYKLAKPYYCVLKPGQMLYIPPKWWHFVESLSLSFSVSFWWE